MLQKKLLRARRLLQLLVQLLVQLLKLALKQ
jgi:hypothetical protein